MRVPSVTRAGTWFEATTLADVLRHRAREQPDDDAYIFLVDGEGGELRYTYAEIDRRARAIAAHLQAVAKRGDRALLLYPSGLDYVSGFFACLYADVIAVPAFPPRLNRPTPRLQAIADASQATLALTTSSVLANLEGRLGHTPGLQSLHWIATDRIDDGLAGGWKDPYIGEEHIAFLQYTSGSTSTPRGVMVSHGNLMANSSLIYHAGATTSDGRDEVLVGGRGFTWLPLYHDMGLIGAILQPAFCGAPCTFMSPLSFLQRPFRWLEGISRLRATHSGGPNFAYDLCARKITPEQKATLDLSCWRMALNGSEPIRKETLDRFTEAFACCGFRREALCPCYGLAEATLMVTGAWVDQPPIEDVIDEAALATHRVVAAAPGAEGAKLVVGSGHVQPSAQVLIVDPDSFTPCPGGRVGEIWVGGPSVCKGYWGRPQDTERTFGGRLADSGEGPYLRTGDLGFFKDGELFVTGRLKDLIIIRGRNYYPQDVEWTVMRSHPALVTDSCAAFALDVAGEERLVVVQEVERQGRDFNPDEVIDTILRAVSQEHELDVYSVVLIKSGTISKTTSGKIQRSSSRAQYLKNELQEVRRWTRPLEHERGVTVAAAGKPHVNGQAHRAGRPTGEAIRTWLVARIAELLRIDPRDVDVHKPLANFGLNSMQAVSLSGELEDWLGTQLAPTLLYDYPTIDTIAAHLGGEKKGEEPAVVHAAPAAGAVATGPIAIVGLSCRLPGAADPEALWRLLENGVDAIREVPASRWDLKHYYDPNPATPGKMSTRWGGFLDQIEEFDRGFFNVSPREAVRMDPQQRLLLELAWEALEDAGIPADKLAGTGTGVFVGISGNDYGYLQLRDPDLSDPYIGTGNALSIAAARLSYLLDFHGPSLAVDTACSSALVAIHLACRSLWNGESSVAIAGGVNMILAPWITVNFSKAGFMAPDGRCKTFDARANGYVRSEGGGLVVLKPLAAALADGDPVYAVIRGTAVNQDGRSQGLTAPNGQAQEAVLREAYRQAGVSPGQVQYVEAHGTGTLLGDPIEARALGKILGQDRPEGNRCLIGSLKSNIGHTEAAAGVAGLIKVALALKHRKVPPSLHFEQPNPHIPFDELPLRVVTGLEPWPEAEGQALAGVSSFGFGGTNAHAVLAEVPRFAPAPREVVPDQASLLALSARSPEALQALAGRYHDWMSGQVNGSVLPLVDVCFTAGDRRSHHEHRLALVAHNREEALERLQAFLHGEKRPGLTAGRKSLNRRPKAVWVFSGQGPQWWGMGRQLLREPAFRAAVQQCDQLFAPLAGWSLLDEFQADEAASRLASTEVAQPALFALQVGLAALWRSWGLAPDAVVGHSLGEVVAAHVAGALSLEDAVKVVYHRGRIMQGATGLGKTAAVEMTPQECDRLLAEYDGRLSVAAVNSPTSLTISGDPAALEDLVIGLQKRNVYARMLRVDYAFHSSQMDPFMAELAAALRGIAPKAAAVPLFSTVTGRASDGTEYGADYWARNIRQTVQFAPVVAQLLEAGHDTFLEVAPHPVLSGSITQCLHERGLTGAVLPSLRREDDDRAVLLGSLGALYAQGHPVDWKKVYPEGRHVRIPGYVWQRERCWVDEEEGANAGWGPPSADRHPLLMRHVRGAHARHHHIWETELDRRRLPYLADHRLQGSIIVPGAAFVEMSLAACAEAFGDTPYVLEDTNLHKALILPEKGSRTVQVVLLPGIMGEITFQIFSRLPEEDPAAAAWTLHADGKVRLGDSAPPPDPTPVEDFKAGMVREKTRADFYQEANDRGLTFGPTFQGVQHVWGRDFAAIGRVRVPESLHAEIPRYGAHPALLDAALQVMGGALPVATRQATANSVLLPVHVDKIRFYAPVGPECWSYSVLEPFTEVAPDRFVGTGCLLDDAGRKLVEFQGVILQRLDHDGRSSIPDKPAEWLHELRWQPQPLPEATAAEALLGSWLIFADAGGTGDALAAELTTRGERCVVVRAGDAYERSDDLRFRLRPCQADDLQRLLAEAMPPGSPPCRGVVHLWSLDAPALGDDAPEALERAQDLGCGSVLTLLQKLVRTGWPAAPQLWLVTRGAQVVGKDPAPVALAQSPLWGMGRVLAVEHPEFHAVRIDLDPAKESADVTSLVEEIYSRSAEDQVAFRGSGRHALRLVPRGARAEGDEAGEGVTPRLRVPDVRPIWLDVTSKGLLDNLVLRPTPFRELGDNEVDIEVHAVGLNFRDVLNVLGLYPGDPIPLGGECAGRVLRVGKNVRDIKPGDEVMAVAPACMGTRSMTIADLVVPKPEHLTFEEAATIPITFLTAYYALHELGRMRAGEKVLLHAAAGGVGLAALQLARLAGAEVFATVGSAAKREFLEAQGVRHIFSSRKVDFADEVRAATGGKGVDVVLNSLAGEFIPASLSLLKPFGRFLEIGRVDIYRNSPIGLAPFKNNLQLCTIDLELVARERPDLVRSMFLEIVRLFRERKLEPLPKTVFPLQEAVAGFRYMQQRKNIGKIVFSVSELQRDQPSGDLSSAHPAVRPDGTYLVTGGLGALGLRVARWLAEQGARHLVLVGRGGAAKADAQALEAVRAAGADVVIVAADVSKREDVARILADIDRSLPPLRGIVHAAGSLDDGFLVQLDQERFRRVFPPKVAGAWNLHALTAGRPLDFFVCFSSAAAVLGSPGQGNYAAANVFMDSLAQARASLGLPALSVNWGPWSEVGMAAQQHLAGSATFKAMGKISPDKGVELLGQMLLEKDAQMAVLPINWKQWRRLFPVIDRSPLLALLARDESADAPARKGGLSADAVLAAPPGERLRLLEVYVAGVLGFSADKLDMQQRLDQLGIDSLMAIELKNRVEVDLGVALTMATFLQVPSVTELAAAILSQLESAAPHEEVKKLDEMVDRLENLSEEEVQALLAEETMATGL
jgi:acyl transferase domain-containing protein/acyl-CoA synthetase (AMP-forming)/AMP-acid ligase II/NADPH:quinone reductase-like Zn-dependent oxidoreductase/acyl carrier protein